MKKHRILSTQRHSRTAAGFTLIEIMLVVAIIAVLLGASIKYLVGNLDAARSTRVEGDLASITTQLKTYEMQNLFMPTTEQGLEALVNEPTVDPKPRRWRQLLEKVPEDPWGMPYQYRNPGVKNAKGFDLFSLGPDRKEGDNDDIGNWSADK